MISERTSAVFPMASSDRFGKADFAFGEQDASGRVGRAHRHIG